ncbi:aminodeoxychorismate lyase [Marinomonas piezotolerans]|nr:aminodeoxychorismate lyase [Marinomonas piezotolerans]
MQWFLNFQTCHTIDVADRGLAYGDGLFETLYSNNGVIAHLDAHLTRLRRGFRRLHFNITTEELALLNEFLLVQAERHQNIGFKIIVTRGAGGRGYMPPESPNYTWLVGLFEIPDYSNYRSHGIRLGRSAIESSINRNLAGLKHLNRLENVLAKQSLNSTEYEAVTSNALGDLVECIQSNIFWVKSGILYTPSLALGGVQGTMRHQIIKHFNGTINIVQQPPYQLMQADEIFLTNALSGVLPVVEFNGYHLPIGPVTKTLIECNTENP